jgi:hypothetical protein
MVNTGRVDPQKQGRRLLLEPLQTLLEILAYPERLPIQLYLL